MVSVNNGGWGVLFATDNTVRLTLVGVSNVASVGTIADTEWHHIAVTYDASMACFYFDGNQDSCIAYAVTFNSSGGDYTIGSRGASEFFDGLIDEVEFFSSAVSAADIKAIFDAGKAGKKKPPVCVSHNGRTIRIAAAALQAHSGHGDVQVACP